VLTTHQKMAEQLPSASSADEPEAVTRVNSLTDLGLDSVVEGDQLESNLIPLPISPALRITSTVKSIEDEEDEEEEEANVQNDDDENANSSETAASSMKWKAAWKKLHKEFTNTLTKTEVVEEFQDAAAKAKKVAQLRVCESFVFVVVFK
jgi:hypothetical protein